MPNGTELTRRLADLLLDPRETLDVEIKQWLDIKGNKEDRARLAKELIALANHGGGYAIIGFSETGTGFAAAVPRPTDLSGYDTDEVNSVVAKYAEPVFHCTVHNVSSPDTGLAYPIIQVPGGHSVPIRAKRSGPKDSIIQQHSYYIRRPGPNSETPQDGREWDELIQRCITNRRDLLLDQFRAIMSGGVELETPPSDLEKLTAWFDSSKARWEEVISNCPVGRGERLEQGHYAFCYQIVGEFERPTVSNFVDALKRSTIRYTGWPQFWVPTRAGIEPYPFAGNVECWLARDGEEQDPAHADFWIASPEGQLFLIRGYHEDAMQGQGIEPGKFFSITTPTWRAGELLLHAASLSRTLGDEDARVIVMMEWTGLRGRELFKDPQSLRFLPGGYTSQQDTFRTHVEVQAKQIEKTLPELVRKIVWPLYELFDFFRLPEELPSQELARMRQHRF